MADVTYIINHPVTGGRWEGQITYDPSVLSASNPTTSYTGTMTFTPDGTVGPSTTPISQTNGSISYFENPFTDEGHSYSVGLGSASTSNGLGTIVYNPYGDRVYTADNTGFAGLSWNDVNPNTAASFYLAPNASSVRLPDNSLSFSPPNSGATHSGNFSIICFYPGTLIATPRGDIRVEDLAIGETVYTVDGEERKIVWIGRQSIATYFADPKAHLPIEFAIGSLGDNLPRRPLRLSPGHSIWFGGVFPIASALVNNSTIRQLTKSEVPEHFTYYHIELEDHALVLAEGVPCETYLDAISRKHFHNWHEYVALYGAEERSIAPLTENNARVTRFEDLPEDLQKFIGSPDQERVDAPVDLQAA